MDVKELVVTRTVDLSDTYLVKVKNFLRVRHNADDDLIKTFMESSIEEFEDFCRMFLYRCTAKSKPRNFCGTSFVLDGYEIDSLVLRTHSSYSDLVGTAIATSEYTVTDEPLGKRINLNTSFDGLLSYEGDFGFSSLPTPIITALMIRCSTLYHSREETVSRLPTTVTTRLNPYKLYRLA